MPQFPFMRSNQDKDREKDPSPPSTSYPNPNLNANSSLSPDNKGVNSSFFSTQQQSQVPQFSHPFASSSTNASTSTINANANDTNNNAPMISPFIPAESPTSKYHPSRLLRRKASLGNKSNETPTFADSDPLPTSGSSSNGINEPITPSSPRRLPSSPRGFPSSPRGFFFDNTSSIAKDKDKDNLTSEREKFSTYPTRRGSDTSRINYNYGLPSPTAIKRSAFVYNGKLTSEGYDEQSVVIIPSASSSNAHVEDELSNNLGALGIKSDIPTQSQPPLSSSLPKVLDGGLGSTSGIGIFGKIMNGNSISNDKHHIDNRDRDRYDRPPTPPDSATTPYYPTALSPPRRPMPRSPRALANSQRQHQEQRSSTPTSYSYSNDNHDSTPPSISMIQAISAVGGPSSSGSQWNNNTSSSPNLRDPNYRYDQTSSPTPLGSNHKNGGRRGSEKPISTKVTAEWLARKPSLSSSSSATTTPNRRKHRPSLSVDQSSQSRTSSSESSHLRHHHLHLRQQSSDSPSRSSSSLSYNQLENRLMNPSTPKRQGSLDDSPKIIEGSTVNSGNTGVGGGQFGMLSYSSSLDSDTDQGQEQGNDSELLSSDADGEIGLNPRRRSLLTTPSRISRKSTISGGTGLGGGYEVIVNCINSKSSGSGTVDIAGGEEEEEIKWEITIKKATIQSNGNSSTNTSSPLQLSTSGVSATAPISASSINLSLSLDKPTGKLVFISFPMDINATPTRKRRPSTVTRLSSNNSNNNNVTSSPRKEYRGVAASIEQRPSTPPNQIQSPFNNTPQNQSQSLTRTPSSRRKPPPAWPSPRTKIDIKPISPPSSPRDGDVFTPKNITTPSRMGVNGDLLNKVTRGEVGE